MCKNPLSLGQAPTVAFLPYPLILEAAGVWNLEVYTLLNGSWDFWGSRLLGGALRRIYGGQGLRVYLTAHGT